MSNAICSISDCNRKREYLRGGGYCRKHYRAYGKHNLCSVEKCNQPVVAYGICGRHRRREILYGDKLAGYNFRRGQSKNPAYRSWVGAKERTRSPNSKDYERYGARGIRMCDGWANDSSSFLSDMGDKPSPDHSLDRIDNDKNYSCGHCKHCIVMGWEPNCRWATRSVQQNNKGEFRYKKPAMKYGNAAESSLSHIKLPEQLERWVKESYSHLLTEEKLELLLDRIRVEEIKNVNK